jgi:glycosyltransferase involved in cell wall biosynthesis
MVRRAAGAIVIAEDIRADFDGLLPPEKVRVVIHGVEPQPAFDAPPSRARGGFTVLYLGALYRRKGLYTLLEAFVQLRQQRPDASLVLAGDWFPASERETAGAFLRTHGLADAVRLTGPVDGEAKWQLYREADVFVFVPEPDYEAFGMVMLEAMQAWLPVVASRGGARSELVSDNVNGLLVPHNDPAALAGALLRLATDPALRERMGRAGHERFTSHYTHEQYGQRMTEVLEVL